jgi:hypothetical protein
MSQAGPKTLTVAIARNSLAPSATVAQVANRGVFVFWGCPDESRKENGMDEAQFYDDLFEETRNDLAGHAFSRVTFDSIIGKLNRKANRDKVALPQTREGMKAAIIHEFKASLK